MRYGDHLVAQAEREGIALSAKTLADLRLVAQDCGVAPLQA